MSASDKFEKIRIIADAICDGEVTDSQARELDDMLKQSDEAKRFYLNYVKLHAKMKVQYDPKIEVVMRRSQTDELIIRPTGFEEQGKPISKTDSSSLPHTSGLKNVRTFPWLGLLLSIAGIGLFLYFYFFKTHPSLGHLVEGRIKDTEHFQYPKEVNHGEFVAEEDSLLKFKNESQLNLKKETQIHILDINKLFLNKGQLSFKQENKAIFKINSDNFKLSTESKSVILTQNESSTQIRLLSNNKYTPKQYRPVHYWSFDQKGDRAIDITNNAHGTIKGEVKRVNGLLGTGAFQFNNQLNEGLNLGNGGGTVLGTGSFATIQGVTVEALIKPEWSGKHLDSDEIFRKDFGDKGMRILFSFQHDDGQKEMAFPRDYAKPTLSFGMYLIGYEYHELKLPIDGKKGRPSLDDLKDGRVHHVVASYDANSGLKAIYIDGVMFASYQYEPGTKMVSGGPGIAMVGNTPRGMDEAFTGTIDEVAFYNIALPPYMIKQHYDHVQKGLNYYGLPPESKTLPSELSIELPINQDIVLDRITGLPILVKETN